MVEKKEKHQFEELSNKIIGAAIEVHRVLGPGFLENIYEQALKIEFSGQNLLCDSQKEIKIKYNGIEIGQHRLDMVVENIIIVELKVSSFTMEGFIISLPFHTCTINPSASKLCVIVHSLDSVD